MLTRDALLRILGFLIVGVSVRLLIKFRPWRWVIDRWLRK